MYIFVEEDEDGKGTRLLSLCVCNAMEVYGIIMIVITVTIETVVVWVIYTEFIHAFKWAQKADLYKNRCCCCCIYYSEH